MVKAIKRKRPATPDVVGTCPASNAAIIVVDDVNVIQVATETASSSTTTTTTTTTLGQLTSQALQTEQSLPNVIDEIIAKIKVPIFKDTNFVHSGKSGQAASKKSRVWKNLKQIITAERAQSLNGPNDVTYASIDAPPSLLPAKKYSDLSGLPAKYMDPQTKLRYASVEEFARLRLLPADIVAAYLSVRKANAPVP